MSKTKSLNGPACSAEIERFTETLLDQYDVLTVIDRLEGHAATIRRRTETKLVERRHESWRRQGIDPLYRQSESLFKTGPTEIPALKVDTAAKTGSTNGTSKHK